MNTFRLISWNINGRTGNTNEQAQAILTRDPDIICLQEVREKAYLTITTLLHQRGYIYHADTIPLALRNQRKKGVLTVPAFRGIIRGW